jgi:hypothetical protein
VSVDGATGTLIRPAETEGTSHYLLMWVKDGFVYVLSGRGSMATAITLADSLK